MLTMDEYDALSETENADAIMRGHFLADRQENGLVIQLYSLGLLYGELYYDPRAGKVLRYRVFEGMQQLVPYLAHIKFNKH